MDPPRPARDPLVLTAVALALVTVTSSAVAGHPADALGTVALLLTMVGAVAVVKALRPEDRRLLAAGIVVLAVIVAVIGWAAVVARWQPDALTSQGLWRAASTLTYENALAAFLTAPALLCLDRLMTAPARSLAWSAAGLSPARRDRSIAQSGRRARAPRRDSPSWELFAGLGPFFAWDRRWSAPSWACPVSPPACPSTRRPTSPWPCAGLVGGGSLAAWTVGSRPAPHRRRRRSPSLCSVSRSPWCRPDTSPARSPGPASPPRPRTAPTNGPPPSTWPATIWSSASERPGCCCSGTIGGTVFTASFAHDEYLQLLTQDGVVGLAVLVVGLAGVFVRLAHLRARDTAWSASCGIACLVALLVQSSLDFLWHIPVIPVLMAVVLALAATEESVVLRPA